MTLSGTHRWHFDTKQRAWTSRGLPGVRIQATILRRRDGSKSLIWRLEPTGEPFIEYQQAMLAAEEHYASYSRRSRRSRQSRQSRHPHA